VGFSIDNVYYKNNGGVEAKTTKSYLVYIEQSLKKDQKKDPLFNSFFPLRNWEPKAFESALYPCSAHEKVH